MNMAEYIIPWMLKVNHHFNWNMIKSYGGYIKKHWLHWAKAYVAILNDKLVLDGGCKKYITILDIFSDPGNMGMRSVI